MKRPLARHGDVERERNRSTERRRLRWRPCSVRGYPFHRCDLPAKLGRGPLSVLIGPAADGRWMAVTGPSAVSDEALAASGEWVGTYPSVEEAKIALGGGLGVRTGARHEPVVRR